MIKLHHWYSFIIYLYAMHAWNTTDTVPKPCTLLLCNVLPTFLCSSVPRLLSELEKVSGLLWKLNANTGWRNLYEYPFPHSLKTFLFALNLYLDMTGWNQFGEYLTLKENVLDVSQLFCIQSNPFEHCINSWMLSCFFFFLR